MSKSRTVTHGPTQGAALEVGPKGQEGASFRTGEESGLVALHWGSFAPPSGHLAMFTGTFGCHNWGQEGTNPGI